MTRAPSWSFEKLKRRGEMIARLEEAGVPLASLQVMRDAELEQMVAALVEEQAKPKPKPKAEQS